MIDVSDAKRARRRAAEKAVNEIGAAERSLRTREAAHHIKLTSLGDEPAVSAATPTRGPAERHCNKRSAGCRWATSCATRSSQRTCCAPSPKCHPTRN